MARIDDHVGPHRHVTGDAARARRAFVVMMVRRRSELVAVMALQTDAVALGAQLQRVRIVAVAARHAGHEHLALAKRRVVIDLVHHLAVGLEQAGLEQARHVRFQQRLPGPPGFGDLAGARVADPAGLQLLGAGPRHAAPRTAGRRIEGPLHVLALVEVDGQAVRAVPVSFCPRHMGCPRAVTGFARDIDLGPGGGVGVRGRVVVLAQFRRMALGALKVPGLVDAGPVQRIARLQVLIGVEMEPALAALFLRPRVPGDAQRLHPSVGKGDQVLLQRGDAEDVADLEIGEFAVRSVGVDEELAVPPEEPRSDVPVGEGGIVEVAEDGGLGRLGHRQVVVRAAPRLALGLVAPGAGGAADVTGRRVRKRRRGDACAHADGNRQNRECEADRQRQVQNFQLSVTLTKWTSLVEYLPDSVSPRELLCSKRPLPRFRYS